MYQLIRNFMKLKDCKYLKRIVFFFEIYFFLFSNRDIWCLRFFAQNGVAFFACWTGLKKLFMIDIDFTFVAVRFVLTFDKFLQWRVDLSIANSGTIALVIAAIIAGAYYFGPNINAALVEK